MSALTVRRLPRAASLRHHGCLRDAGASALTREGITMKNVMLCTAMLLLACSLTVRAAEKREQTYKVGADVNAQGHITATQVEPGVPASIAAALSAAVKQWQFTPATLDGRPVPAHTFISARLQALPNTSGQYNLRVSFKGNGPIIDLHSVHPQYPREAIRTRQPAFTMLEATVLPDGSLTDMTVSSRFKEWPLPPYFKTAVLAAAKQWHAIPEQVDGRPVATRMRIPINFTIEGETFTYEQAQVLRKAAREETATENAEAAQPSIPLPSEQEVALDSPLRPSAVASITNAP
jgi:TonB family protein